MGDKGYLALGRGQDGVSGWGMGHAGIAWRRLLWRQLAQRRRQAQCKHLELRLDGLLFGSACGGQRDSGVGLGGRGHFETK